MKILLINITVMYKCILWILKNTKFKCIIEVNCLYNPFHVTSNEETFANKAGFVYYICFIQHLLIISHYIISRPKVK